MGDPVEMAEEILRQSKEIRDAIKATEKLLIDAGFTEKQSNVLIGIIISILQKRER